MRRFLYGIALVLIFCACAYADAMLYRGSGNVGAVPSIDNNSALCVSVEDAGKLLGFAVRRSGEELLLTRGNAQLRISEGAAAGWHGYAIVPLYSAPFERNGKLWLDAQSTAALFQTVAGKGASNRLRFAKISGYTATPASARDFGEFDEPTPAPTQAKKQEATIDIDAILNRTSTARTKPQTPTPQPQTAQAPQVQPEQPAISASSQETAPVMAASPQTVKPSAKRSSGKSQPRMETFKPDDSKTEKGENYSGTIQGIRWTTQEGTHKKIRAVIMADDDSDPQVFMDNGKLHALFSSSLENSAGVASPFASNVNAEIKAGIDGVDLVFTPKGITKAEKLVLNNPRRIVFDFFYPEEANIIGTSPKKAETNIQLPGQVPQNQTAQTPIPSTSERRADPVITSNPSPEPAVTKTPAVLTPPSTITIPTSSQAAQRLGRINNGRKTIVIDPGHGGKDPGAMDNGVREKDVNLAVGLELQRALTAKGYNVVMTRDTDIYLKLQERTDIANNVNADLFVSVHVNALPNKKSMTGFEIYIMALPTDKDAMNLAKIENREYVEGKGMDTANVDRRTEMLLRILGDMQQNNKISESTDFAAMLYNAGVRGGLQMRRVAQAPFFVLRGAGMPAVLLEIGFVTNANESRLLMTQPYQQRIAAAMSEGIANYIR